MRAITIPQITALDATTAVSDAVFAGPVGRSVQVTSVGSNLPALVVGDIVIVQNHSVLANNGVYSVSVVTTSTSDYRFSKVSGVAPVAAASEAVDVEEPRGMTHIEAENPSLYVVANVGAFGFTVEYSLDGITWFDSGISAISTLGVTVLTGKILWVKLNMATIGTSLDVGYAA